MSVRSSRYKAKRPVVPLEHEGVRLLATIERELEAPDGTRHRVMVPVFSRPEPDPTEGASPGSS